jgi:hypothetical protein
MYGSGPRGLLAIGAMRTPTGRIAVDTESDGLPYDGRMRRQVEAEVRAEQPRDPLYDMIDAMFSGYMRRDFVHDMIVVDSLSAWDSAPLSAAEFDVVAAPHYVHQRVYNYYKEREMHGGYTHCASPRLLELLGRL